MTEVPRITIAQNATHRKRRSLANFIPWIDKKTSVRARNKIIMQGQDKLKSGLADGVENAGGQRFIPLVSVNDRIMWR